MNKHAKEHPLATHPAQQSNAEYKDRSYSRSVGYDYSRRHQQALPRHQDSHHLSIHSASVQNRHTTHPRRIYNDYDPARSERRCRQDIRDVERNNVRNTRRVARNVSKLREELSKYYNEDLHAFLQDKARQDLEAAKLEFDQKYFLEQERLTHEQVLAENEEVALEISAKDVRASPKEEETSDFGDWTDDGYDDSGFVPECPIWWLEEGRISRWVDLERERLGLNSGEPITPSQSDWAIEEPITEPGGRTILPLGDGLEPHLEDLSEGKWRQKIDDWRHKQDKIRAQPKLGTLYWWQEATGI